MTTLTYDITQPLEGFYTEEQVRERLAFCEEREFQPGVQRDQDNDSFAYSARALFLYDLLGSWNDLEQDDEGRREVDEDDYRWMLESLADEQGYPSVYEEGMSCHGTYAWQCYALEGSTPGVMAGLKDWMEKRRLPAPEWASEPRHLFYEHFRNWLF
jgi:hypothetical protein